MIPLSPTSTLFPYTTLFRSREHLADLPAVDPDARRMRPARCRAGTGLAPTGHRVVRRLHARSEEHTSELQSRQYLVCRLLLEKKKIYIKKNTKHTHTRVYHT